MGDARQYCLKWNNHPRNVATVFDRLRAEELFVDVTLATADRQLIRAHRVLLSAGSAYLERVLAMNPSEHPTIVLSNIRYKELKLLVDFMYSGEIAVGQAQFPSLMESANWLMVRGLCTEDVKEEGEREQEQEQEEKELSELTVTPTGRKRQHSVESEEEEEEEQIVGPEEEEEEEMAEGGQAAKHPKPMYGAIHGVANAVWMMQEKEEGIREGQGESSDLVTVAGSPITAPAPSKAHQLLNPTSLNEQLLQAMQLCTSPYLNPLAAMHQPKQNNLNLLSPNSSFSSFHSSPFKASSPMKNTSLMSGAPVRRYKQYTEDSLQAALKEIMNGQSINRSSMKHSIPARTLRDWMKRLNIKSVFTHHTNGKERAGGSGGGSGGSQGDQEEASLASTSPEPLASPTFGLSPTSLSLIRNGFIQEEEIDDDEGGEEEEGGLRIDEGPGGGVVPMQQIAQVAN